MTYTEDLENQNEALQKKCAGLESDLDAKNVELAYYKPKKDYKDKTKSENFARLIGKLFVPWCLFGLLLSAPIGLLCAISYFQYIRYDCGKTALWEGKTVRVLSEDRGAKCGFFELIYIVKLDNKEIKVSTKELSRLPDEIDESLLKIGKNILYKGQVARILTSRYPVNAAPVFTLRVKETNTEVTASYEDLSPLKEKEQ